MRRNKPNTNAQGPCKVPKESNSYEFEVIRIQKQKGVVLGTGWLVELAFTTDTMSVTHGFKNPTAGWWQCLYH